MIIDSEGLQSIEKSDPEYDRKITLFCLAVSHLVIINVKDQFNDDMKKILEVCVDTLNEMDANKIPAPEI